MDSLTAGAVILGIVNGLQMAFPVISGKYAFLAALILGIILGLAHLFGLNVETGIVTALASSGLYKVAQKVGGQ